MVEWQTHGTLISRGISVDLRECKKVYGPYKCNTDNRYRIVLLYLDGTKKTVSYPKYIMEIHLDRYLSETETVDHINQDVTDNAITNLRILDRNIHSYIDSKTRLPQQFIYPVCNSVFILSAKQLSQRIINTKYKKVLVLIVQNIVLVR